MHDRRNGVLLKILVIIMHCVGWYTRSGVGDIKNNGCTTADEKVVENWRTSQFRETTSVKDNECVEPIETPPQVPETTSAICAHSFSSRRDPNAGGK